MTLEFPSPDTDRFTPADLDRIGQHTPGHRIRAPQVQAPVLEGRFHLAEAPTGIGVHATDLVELESFEVSFTAPAGLKILVQLKGETACVIDGKDLTLSANDHAVAQLFVLPRPVQITRRCRAGCQVRKVMLTVPADWFEAVPGPLGFTDLARLADEAGTLKWHPSLDALQAAEALLAARCSGLAAQFDRDRAALAIVQEGTALFDRLTAGVPLRSVEMEKIAAAQRYIADNLRPDLTTAEIARSLGVSTRVLERLFRHGTGQTLGQFRRSHGLKLAKTALQRGRVSVSEAAEIAGYGNPTSFTVAFQRAFGTCPSMIKAQRSCV